MFTNEEALEMLNIAYKQLGFPDDRIITEENIQILKELTKEQLESVMNNAFLLAKQRQFQNIFDASKNPLREFIFDQTEDGWTIQDIMLEILDGFEPYWSEVYSDEDVLKGLVKDYEQKIRTEYHMRPYSKQFATTINRKDIPKYFKKGGAERFINSKIGNLTSSAERYIYRNVLIDTFKNMVDDKTIKIANEKFDLNSLNGLKHFVERVKVITSGFTKDTNLYNADEVISITPDKSYIYIAVKASVLERIKVYLYSGAYNMEELVLPDHIIELPENVDLGTDENNNPVDMVIFDRRALCIGIRTYEVTNFFVANELKWNYFLSIEGIRGTNSFINCVGLATGGVGNFLDEGSDSQERYLTLFAYYQTTNTVGRVIKKLIVDDIDYTNQLETKLFSIKGKKFEITTTQSNQNVSFNGITNTNEFNQLVYGTGGTLNINFETNEMTFNEQIVDVSNVTGMIFITN